MSTETCRHLMGLNMGATICRGILSWLQEHCSTCSSLSILRSARCCLQQSTQRVSASVVIVSYGCATSLGSETAGGSSQYSWLSNRSKRC